MYYHVRFQSRPRWGKKKKKEREAQQSLKKVMFFPGLIVEMLKIYAPSLLASNRQVLCSSHSQWQIKQLN